MTTRTAKFLTAILALTAASNAIAADKADFYHRGHVALAEEVVFGGEDGPEEAVLFRVSGFAVDEDGNVLVPDSKLHCIKKYDPSGELVAEMGQNGAGPGDLRQPGSILICENGDLLVYEMGNRRIQRLTPAGDHVSEMRCPDFVTDMAFGPNEALFAKVYVIPRHGNTPETTHRIVRQTGDPDSLDVLDEFTAVTNIVVTRGDMTTVTFAPYPPRLLWDVLPDGRLVVGHSNTNEIRLLEPEGGDVMRAVTIEGEAPRVTKKHEREYLSLHERYGEIDPAIRAEMKFPERLPYFSRITVDDEGYILVRWGDTVDGKVTYVVLDGEAELVSRVEMDDHPEHILIRGNMLYALDRSPEVLPTITRYRMEYPGRRHLSNDP